ncbi:MAG: sugar ABC transporter permease, partial [Lachnospiraceae bacterium]|nr:sugar ABC transporter permease [Lachnospiraceae bacterium]
SMVDSPFNPSFAGISNFTRLLSNSAFQDASRNTAIFSFTAVPLAVGLSLLMAVILEQNIPLRSAFRTFFLTPLMVPTASVVLIWQVFFHYNGVINEFMLNLGKGKIDWFKSSASYIVLLVLFLWKNLGYNMILFLAALNDIPAELLEVSDLDGATGWQKFIYIKLRYLSPTILFVALMSLVNSFKVFREVYLLTGDYPVDTLYMLQHFMNNTFKSLDYQKLSAAAVIMFAVIALIIGILFGLEDRFGRDLEG